MRAPNGGRLEQADDDARRIGRVGAAGSSAGRRRQSACGAQSARGNGRDCSRASKLTNRFDCRAASSRGRRRRESHRIILGWLANIPTMVFVVVAIGWCAALFQGVTDEHEKAGQRNETSFRFMEASRMLAARPASFVRASNPAARLFSASFGPARKCRGETARALLSRPMG